MGSAISGKLDREVPDCIRREHTYAARSGSPSQLLNVQVNLGSAILNMANAAKNPAEFESMYKESDDVRLAALRLQPSNAEVRETLAVRMSRGSRVEPQAFKQEISAPDLDRKCKERTESSKDIREFQDGCLEMTFDRAVSSARQGDVYPAVLDAMRHEHSRKDLTAARRAKVASILGVTLMNHANNDVNVENFLSLYYESERALRDALDVDPANRNLAENLITAQKNLKRGRRLLVFNPHITPLGRASCNHALLRRVDLGQLVSTLFTCDDGKDGGLLWMYESEHLRPGERLERFRAGRRYRHGLAYDSRSLVWRGRLCWISTGKASESEYALFHCIGIDEFLHQMELSRQQGQLRPLLAARGGQILTEHFQQIEKNWSPFVVGDALYITYSTQPHVVLGCRWDAEEDRLRCKGVQWNQNPLQPAPLNRDMNSHSQADLRGSSTAVPLPGSGDYLALGHIKASLPNMQYLHYFYRFSGEGPPFHMVGFSSYFALSPASIRGREPFDYGHGIALDGEDLIVTFGININSAWYMRVPLAAVLNLFEEDIGRDGYSLSLAEWAGATPQKYPAVLFGRSIDANLADAGKALLHSPHPAARQFSSQFSRLHSMGLDKYLLVSQESGAAFFNTSLVLLRRIDRCAELEEKTGANRFYSPGWNVCAEAVPEWGQAVADAETAFWVRVTILAGENEVMETILGQELCGRAADGRCSSHVRQRPYKRGAVTERQICVPSSTMSYKLAMRFAFSGKINQYVLDAIRREHADAEISAPLYHRLNVKVNLGSVLLNLANAAESPAEYARMYEESKTLLLKALKLQPFNAAAKKNLEAVQKNRDKRGVAPSASAFDYGGVQAQETLAEQRQRKIKIDSDKHACYVNSKSDAGKDSMRTQENPENESGKLINSRFSNSHFKSTRPSPPTEHNMEDDFQLPPALHRQLIKEVDRAMQPREHAPSGARAPAPGPAHKRADVKARLGKALLSLAGGADDPAEQRMMLEESEALLLSALELDPGNTDADRSLAILRWNRDRAGAGSSSAGTGNAHGRSASSRPSRDSGG